MIFKDEIDMDMFIGFLPLKEKQLERICYSV